MNASPTSDEKIMAALAHGSIFLAFLGPIIPAVIWTSQRQKSKFVSFHALQAMGYQAFSFWLWIVGMILIVVFSILLLFPLLMLFENSHNSEYALFIFQIFIFISIFGLMGIVFLTGIVGAIYCLLGRDFRYPVLGTWLARYLAYETSSESQIDETHEDNWVADICHATVILRLWGIATPLIIWFSQKERSARLRFQSMQAFVYQLIMVIGYFLGIILYFVFFFGTFFTLILSRGTGNSQEIHGPAGVFMMILFGSTLVFWLVFLILVPIYYLLAGFASFRVIRGYEFHYPILGKILESRMRKSQKSLEGTS